MAPVSFFTSGLLFILSLSVTTATPLVNPSIATRAACSPEIKSLVGGINKNIMIQQQEQAQTTMIQTQQAAKPPNDAQIQQSQAQLVMIVKMGATQRALNQKMAPAGNAAIAGLGKVQMAQATELKMAQALTGKTATDKANLDTLQTMFAGGIKQNQQNAKDAAQGCTI